MVPIMNLNYTKLHIFLHSTKQDLQFLNLREAFSTFYPKFSISILQYYPKFSDLSQPANNNYQTLLRNL